MRHLSRLGQRCLPIPKSSSYQTPEEVRWQESHPEPWGVISEALFLLWTTNGGRRRSPSFALGLLRLSRSPCVGQESINCHCLPSHHVFPLVKLYFHGVARFYCCWLSYLNRIVRLLNGLVYSTVLRRLVGRGVPHQHYILGSYVSRAEILGLTDSQIGRKKVWMPHVNVWQQGLFTGKVFEKRLPQCVHWVTIKDEMRGTELDVGVHENL